MSANIDSTELLIQQHPTEQSSTEEKEKKEPDSQAIHQFTGAAEEGHAHEAVEDAEEAAEEEIAEEVAARKGNKRLQALVMVGGALTLGGFLYYTWINAPWMEKRPRQNEIVVRDPKSSTPMPDDSNDVRRVLDQLRAQGGAQGAPQTQTSPTTNGTGAEAQANHTDQLASVSNLPNSSRNAAPLPNIPAAYWATSFNANPTTTSPRNEVGDSASVNQPTSNNGSENITSTDRTNRGESREGSARTTVHGTGEQTRSIRVSTERPVAEGRKETSNAPVSTPTREISETKLPFGTQLPVRLVGQISSLNSSIPIRLELVDDFQAGTLRLAKGTKFIAEMTNAFAGRIQARVVGFISRNQRGEENLVPIEGQLLGNDAAPGLIGVERVIRTNKRSALTNALSRVGQAGLSVARGALYGLGIGGQVGAQAIDSVASPELYVYQDSSGYFRYVEVQAGVFGYVLITTIPHPTAP